MRVKELFYWINERHSIYKAKAVGRPKPWTKDVILQQYRFCNVYRELDTTTQWIANHWRTPHHKDPHLWFAMVAARLFNWPETLEYIGYPVPFSAKNLATLLHNKKAAGDKLFSGAYIVSTNGRAMDKVDYLMQYVLQPLWKDRMAIVHGMTSLVSATLQQRHTLLCQYDGLGSFMAAQVLADLKYVKPYSQADDWHTWAASGPGSRRGLNRVYDRTVDGSWNERAWLEALQDLHKAIAPLVKRAGMPELHAQDLQNCLCEFDKYERTRLGEGRPRNTYPGR